MSDDLLSHGVVETVRQVHSGALSARAITEAVLARIDALDSELHAFVSVDSEGALAQADAVDIRVARGEAGPLAGVSIGIKDLLDIEGKVTGGGMGFLKERAAADSTVVAKLRAAGAIIIGKLVTTEGATTDHHPDFPRPINPWGRDWWTGISSSGSGVAVAARMCHAAIGTDTGGSIRMPAGASGVTGLKPTWGRVSRAGLFPLSASLDHIGPLARDATDCAALLQVIAGRDPRDATSSAEPVEDYTTVFGSDMRGLTIGIDRRFLEEDVDADVKHAIDQTNTVLVDAGAKVREIIFPEAEPVAGAAAEIAAAHEHLFAIHADSYGPRLRAIIEAGRAAAGLDILRGAAARQRFQGNVAAVIREVDLVVTPTFAHGCPRDAMIEAIADDLTQFARVAARFMLPFNMSGLPSIVFPAGLRPTGPPISVQFAARHWREADALRAAHVFQRTTDFHCLQAPLVSSEHYAPGSPVAFFADSTGRR